MRRTQAWAVGLNSRISRHAGTVTRMRQFSVLCLGCGAWVGAVFEAANGSWAAHMCNNNARLAGCREAAAAATVQLGSIALRPACAPVIAGEHACAHACVLEILIDLGQHLVHQRLGWLRSEAGSCTGGGWQVREGCHSLASRHCHGAQGGVDTSLLTATNTTTPSWSSARCTTLEMV